MTYLDTFDQPAKSKENTIEAGNYHFFYGGPYSQWAESHFNFFGLHFNTAEQFMMLGKAIVAHDRDSAVEIMETPDPRDQKALGRKVKDLPLEMWERDRYAIVLLGNFLKFTQNAAYRAVLDQHETVDLFVEASPTDKIWGIGLSEAQAQGTTPDQWNGTNLLGKVVTDIRDLLVFGQDFNYVFTKLGNGLMIMENGIEHMDLN